MVWCSSEEEVLRSSDPMDNGLGPIQTNSPFPILSQDEYDLGTLDLLVKTCSMNLTQTGLRTTPFDGRAAGSSLLGVNARTNQVSPMMMHYRRNQLCSQIPLFPPNHSLGEAILVSQAGLTPFSSLYFPQYYATHLHNWTPLVALMTKMT